MLRIEIISITDYYLISDNIIQEYSIYTSICIYNWFIFSSSIDANGKWPGSHIARFNIEQANILLIGGLLSFFLIISSITYNISRWPKFYCFSNW